MNLQDLVKVCSNYSSNRASFSNNNYIGAIVFSKFFYIVFLSPSKLFKTFLKTFSTIFREYEGRRLAHCRVSAILASETGERGRKETIYSIKDRTIWRTGRRGTENEAVPLDPGKKGEKICSQKRGWNRSFNRGEVVRAIVEGSFQRRRGKVGLFFRERSNSRQSARYNPISVIQREGRKGKESVGDKKHRRANVHPSR